MVVAAKGGGSSQDESAKHMFDRIGEEVQAKAEVASKKYFDELHGSLKDAIFEEKPKKQQTQGNPCQLDYQYHTNATRGKNYPCRNGKEERFSEVHGGECDNKKIRDNEDDRVGACAPYRRLHLCVRNLENISNYEKINKDTLLADVCLAALHEGAAISADHGKYQQTNDSSQICTMLARSFADIGDIVRGKDLYRGNNGKDKLEENLRKIFKEIHEKLKDSRAKEYYKDENGGNFFKLREDWWNNNRKIVWYAITCGVKGNKYFRPTCSNDTSDTNEKCRCPIYKVPTYFDYVPQFLRWFEEWGEEFCRLRKHKLQNAIKKCRGDSGNDRYCDLNGFDCEKTARGAEIFVKGDDCHKCTVPCDNFVHWIDNQKLEFDKQKKKYTQEIEKYKNGTKQATNGTTNNLYVKDFYERLKTHYGSVNQFLQKLNDESICKKPPKVGNEKASTVDFNNEVNTTFSHTEYCQACPWCGAQKKSNGGTWERLDDISKCEKEKKTYKKENITEIPVLTPDKGKSNILDKYKNFCENGANGGDQIKNWECYYYKENENNKDNESRDSNICVLQNDNIGKEEEKKIMPYHPFFWKWVTEMLIDSMYWRKELKRCINNKRGKCNNNKCNRDCQCYKKWVQHMRTEWEQIEKHFKTQPDFHIFGYDFALKILLNIDELFENIKDTYGDVKEIKDINQMLENEKNQEEAAGAVTENKNTIDLMIDHEQKEAQNCLQKDTCLPPPPPQPKLGRSEEGSPDSPPPITNHHEDDEDDHIDDPNNIRELNIKDEEGKQPDFKAEHSEEGGDDGAKESEEVKEVKDTEEEKENKDETHTEDTQPDGPATTEEAVPTKDVDPCQIVKTLFGDVENLKQACPTKYVNGREKFPNWKCISDSGVTTTTSSGKSDGSICVPPRRRRLYVGKLEEWASGNTQEGGKAAQVDAASTSSPTDATHLRDAFIQSAAIETFFLWDRYKKLNTPQSGSPLGVGGAGIPGAQPLSPELPRSGSDDPQTSLQNGTIPPDFLRLMFYTLGDYRDILFSNTDIVLEALSSSDKENMQKIKENIEKLLPKNGKPSPPQTGQTAQQWWSQNGQHIWNAMVCALSYDTNTKNGEKPTQINKVKEALFGKDEKPDNTPKGNSGTFESKYEYSKVVLKEDDTGAKSTQTVSPSGENTPLTDFISRPPYFRYLEEWGETFCRQRTRMLEKIKEECRSGNTGKEHCSGDGHYCKTSDLKHNDMFAGLDCPGCYKQCRKYRKWIDIKFVEYHKQEKKYEGEHDKLTNGDNKEFCKKIQQHTTAAVFLKALKHCKDDQTDGEKDEDKKNNKIDFSKPLETFSRSTYCKTCPLNGVNCNGSKRGKNGCTEFKKNRETWESVFNANGEKTTINVEMIDRRGQYMKDNLEEFFKTSCLLKSVRDQGWTCKISKKFDVCKLKNVNNDIDINPYTTFKVLLHYWLEDFLYGYYISKKKIEKCTQKEKNTCDEETKKNCVCVKTWVEQKEKEWKEIKDHFKDRKPDDGDNILSKVKNFLEELIPLMDLTNGKEKIQELNKFLKSYACKCDGSSKKENSNEDVIQCMLEDLKTKTTSCKDKHSGEPCVNHTPLEDDDEPFEETENPVTQPNICPKPPEPEPEPVDEGKCGEDTPEPKKTEDEESKKKKDESAPASPETPPPATPPTDGQKPQDDKSQVPEDQIKQIDNKPAPAPASHPEPQPSPPLPSDNTSDILKTTIPFGIAIALTSIVFLFLKKKTKSSVGNLFQILQIPKGDYDIPTKLSPNRYIPYTSGKYRGKRYIYLEGDSGTDSGYTDHYSDITSSSESEYEEMDINDIYVPGSPKYKTLIEVVLEPSGKLSGNTIPTSGKNTPSDNTPTNKFADNEWNTLKHDFISQYLQSEQPNDIPNDYKSGDIPLNTQPNTLYFDKPEEKPFITSIHDRDLYTGEEYNYDTSTNSGNNDLYNGKNNVYGGQNNVYSGIDPTSDNRGLTSGKHDSYSGIDLINDSLSGDYDIYNEMLKRKENELFGTEHHPKRTTTNHFATPTRDDPLHNQLELFHKWLDRHRDMCEQWENHHERLAKLKEEWENETHSGNTHPSDSNKTLNTDVSIQIHMDNPKTTNEFTYVDSNPNQVDDTYVDSNPDNSTMDTILEDLDKPFNEPYYYDMYDDDIYYDVNDHDASTVDSNNMDVPSKVQIEMDVNTKLVKEKYPISDVWDI
ncbi:erythrocyte membrane protein 1 [Plasmodium falciparum IGH-CR14]|uniref:Erythrocyte membrane protein 1 n=1 Tax=Plasmodium falciparum IGH-CR14 TaxID=580059 RepID=A0A0L1I5P4_PLAFA|nr:erythrocyte membrane protein 1 [Plasmodium falciparum IGH-CR14]